MQRGVLGTSAMQRRWAQFSLNEEVSVKPYDPFATGVDIYLAMLKVEVGFLRKSTQNTDDFDTEKMSEAFSNVRLYIKRDGNNVQIIYLFCILELSQSNLFRGSIVGI